MVLNNFFKYIIILVWITLEYQISFGGILPPQIKVTSTLSHPPSCEMYLARTQFLVKQESEIADLLKSLSMQKQVTSYDLEDLRLLFLKYKIDMPENQANALTVQLKWPKRSETEVSTYSYYDLTLPGLIWNEHKDLLPTFVHIEDNPKDITINFQTSYLFYCLNTDGFYLKIYQNKQSDRSITFKTVLPKAELWRLQ